MLDDSEVCSYMIIPSLRATGEEGFTFPDKGDDKGKLELTYMVKLESKELRQI